MFSRELVTKWLDCINNNSFELVRNLSHERCNLLHESVNAGLISSLQQCSNSQSSNASVAIRNEVFQIKIASCHSRWMVHCNLVQSPHGCKPQSGLGRTAEQLQNRDRRGQIFSCDAMHVHHRMSRFVDHLLKPGCEVVNHCLTYLQRKFVLSRRFLVNKCNS